MNDGVVFYRSFYEAIKQIDNAEEKAKLYEMIIDYGLDGIEPENKDLISQVIFIMAKPQIDANIKRASNGKKGGRCHHRFWCAVCWFEYHVGCNERDEGRTHAGESVGFLKKSLYGDSGRFFGNCGYSELFRYCQYCTFVS